MLSSVQCLWVTQAQTEIDRRDCPSPADRLLLLVPDVVTNPHTRRGEEAEREESNHWGKKVYLAPEGSSWLYPAATVDKLWSKQRLPSSGSHCLAVMTVMTLAS